MTDIIPDMNDIPPMAEDERGDVILEPIEGTQDSRPVDVAKMHGSDFVGSITAKHAVEPVNNNQEEEDLKRLPANEDAEQSLLGALLIDNRLVEKVSDFLEPKHFYQPVHGRIYEAILRYVDRGQVADPVTLKMVFDEDDDLSHVGGAQYLTHLAANVITTVSVDHYGQVVYELFLRRELIDIGRQTMQTAYDSTLDEPAEQQIEGTEQRLYDLATKGDHKKGFVDFKTSLTTSISVAEKAFKNVGAVTGVTTGLTDLDKKLGGLQPSDLLILAGRPSMGKTALATCIAFNCAKASWETKGKSGGPVGFFSLEMSSDQLATRILAGEALVPGDKIRRGEVKDTDFRRFVEKCQLLMDVPLFIDDTPSLSISAVRTRARRLKRQHGLGMIVVDYLQLLTGSGKASENRVQEVSEITRGLKGLAKELHIPVLALSQLSRQVESREDKRPMMSDLRESGSIEQDADVVMFVYREQYYLERAEPSRRVEESDDKFNDRYESWQQKLAEVHNVGECILAKQRHGPIGTVKMFFDGQYTRFSDLDPNRQ